MQFHRRILTQYRLLGNAFNQQAMMNIFVRGLGPSLKHIAAAVVQTSRAQQPSNGLQGSWPHTRKLIKA